MKAKNKILVALFFWGLGLFQVPKGFGQFGTLTDTTLSNPLNFHVFLDTINISFTQAGTPTEFVDSIVYVFQTPQCVTLTIPSTTQSIQFIDGWTYCNESTLPVDWGPSTSVLTDSTVQVTVQVTKGKPITCTGTYKFLKGSLVVELSGVDPTCTPFNFSLKSVSFFSNGKLISGSVR